MVSKKKKIGLIIGSGGLAIYCMEQLVLLDYEIIILRLPCSKIKIKKNIDYIDIYYETISDALSFLRKKSICEITLIGYVERPVLDVLKASHNSQKILLKIVSSLNKGDGAIFTAVKEMLIEENFRLLKVQDLLPELTLPSGRYGSSFEEKKTLCEIKSGLAIFRKYAKLDIGQSLIIKGGHCLGLETITGTDEMIKAVVNYRKSKFAELASGGVLIKGSKPKQILDIDTPVIGPNTIKLANKASLTGLVVESNKVILVNKGLIFDLLQSFNMFIISTNFLYEDF